MTSAGSRPRNSSRPSRESPGSSRGSVFGAFATEDETAVALADFDILLTMRERMAFPETLIRRLLKLHMIDIAGGFVATLDAAACTRQGLLVCNPRAVPLALPMQQLNWPSAC